jgi:hypothetical protein
MSEQGGRDMSATQLLYRAAGFEISDADERCWLCGGPAFDPTPRKEFVKPTFTDHDKVACPDSGVVCGACVFCHDEQSELLTKLVGKWWLTAKEALTANPDRIARWQKKNKTDKSPTPEQIKLIWAWDGWSIPQRMRNYSHFVVGGEWMPLGKGDKSRMAELLTQGPELAVIALSGQKHLIFRAQPGWWQVEEQSVLPFPDKLRELLGITEALYAGFSKAEIESGDYKQYRIRKFGLSTWWALESQIKPERGGLPFQLALFLAQKKKGEGDGRESSTSSGSTGNRLAGSPVRLQEPLSEEHLATVRGQYPVGGLHQQPRQVSQLTLFEAWRRHRA